MSDATKRYITAINEMQAAVTQRSFEGSMDAGPEYLRVGVNVALSDQAALVRLLVAKGVFTLAEYHQAIASEMEDEVKRDIENRDEVQRHEERLPADEEDRPPR